MPDTVIGVLKGQRNRSWRCVGLAPDLPKYLAEWLEIITEGRARRWNLTPDMPKRKARIALFGIDASLNIRSDHLR